MNQKSGEYMVHFPVAPERTALINVDMQNAFVEGYPLSAPEGLNVLARINRLSDACRRAGVLVVHTRSVFRADGSNLGVLGEIDPRTKMGLLFDGAKGAELHAHLVVAAADIVLNKPRFGAFHDTDLDLILRSRGVDTVFITGVATNVCCDTTAREASVRGYRVLFASDGTATLSMGGVSPADLQAATCATLAQVFAQITTVDEMIAKVGGANQTSSSALSDGFEKALLRTHESSRRVMNGDAGPMKDAFSHSRDVMIMGAWGSYEHGWTNVGPRLEWAAGRFAEERNATCERLTAGESGDLAYEIFLEKADTRLAGEKDFHPMALRVTHISRREQGEWKIIQRHADFLTPRAG
jgi:ureidoacrylate peracid hydrolase